MGVRDERGFSVLMRRIICRQGVQGERRRRTSVCWLRPNILFLDLVRSLEEGSPTLPLLLCEGCRNGISFFQLANHRSLRCSSYTSSGRCPCYLSKGPPSLCVTTKSTKHISLDLFLQRGICQCRWRAASLDAVVACSIVHPRLLDLRVFRGEGKPQASLESN